MSEALFLDDNPSLLYYHIINEDGNFVIRSGDAYLDNYFERIRKRYDTYGKKTPDTYAMELAAAMAFTCAAAGTHELSRAFEYNMGLVAELSPLIAASFEDYENDPGSLFRDRRARCDRNL